MSEIIVDNIEFSDLASISNDCLITKNVYNTLREKLSNDEIKDFKMWLKLINYYGQLNKKV